MKMLRVKVIILCIFVVPFSVHSRVPQWEDSYEGTNQWHQNSHKNQHRVYNYVDGNGYSTSVSYRGKDYHVPKSLPEQSERNHRYIRPHRQTYHFAGKIPGASGHFSSADGKHNAYSNDRNRAFGEIGHNRRRIKYADNDYNFEGRNRYTGGAEHDTRRVKDLRNYGKSMQYFRIYNANSHSQQELPENREHSKLWRSRYEGHASSKNQLHSHPQYANTGQKLHFLRPRIAHQRYKSTTLKEESLSPAPYESRYSIQPEDGSDLWQVEAGDSYGGKTGEYGYTDPNGIYRRVKYKADENGFRAWIETNEPSSINSNPADVTVTVSDTNRSRDKY